MTLLAVLLATLIAGVGSVWVAALLLRTHLGAPPQPHGPQYLLSLAAGALLATAFMHLLPEALESSAGAHELFATLLVCLILFFLLDKAELWHHGHEHGTQHAHEHNTPRAGGWAVLTGDSVHCFGDGMLIASAFMADMRLGWVSALSVLAHEVPHHMGDLMVLRQTSDSRRAALIKVSLAGAMTGLGGLGGFFLVEQLRDWLPFFLVVASSSFVYVALADLMPQLQQRLSVRQTALQVAVLLFGIALVTVVSDLAHGH